MARYLAQHLICVSAPTREHLLLLCPSNLFHCSSHYIFNAISIMSIELAYLSKDSKLRPFYFVFWSPPDSFLTAPFTSRSLLRSLRFPTHHHLKFPRNTIFPTLPLNRTSPSLHPFSKLLASQHPYRPYISMISPLMAPNNTTHPSDKQNSSVEHHNPSNTVHTKVWYVDQECDLVEAAACLASGGLVAFPTETVYGLGADATSDTAIQALYTAKGRPQDNPLIVHFASLHHLKTSNAKAIADHVFDETTTSIQQNTEPNTTQSSSARQISRDTSLKESEFQSQLAISLATKFWPGPLTLVLPVHPESALSSLTTAGLDTVGVRVPSSPAAQMFLNALGPHVPVAAPSANTSGRPSPTSAVDVVVDLKGKINGVLATTRELEAVSVCDVGIESTIVDLTTYEGRQNLGPTEIITPVILRPGIVTKAQLERATGVRFRLHHSLVDMVPPHVSASASESKVPEPLTATVEIESESPSLSVSNPMTEASNTAHHPKAPGMKYRHYAPRAPLYIVPFSTDSSTMLERIHLFLTQNNLLSSSSSSPASASLSSVSLGIMASSTTIDRIKIQLVNKPLSSFCSSWPPHIINNIHFVSLGDYTRPSEAANKLYASLRSMDGERGSHGPVSAVLVEEIPTISPTYAADAANDLADQNSGVVLAVMNRLRKAAGAKIDLEPKSNT